MRTTAVALIAVLTGCITDEGDDPIEDLGAIDGKADKITTRNVTLKPRTTSGRPSRRSFTVKTAHAFRVSVAYAEDAATRVSVLDGDSILADSGETWQPTVVVPAATAARSLVIRVENTAGTEVRARIHAATPDGRALRVATFNIRWYGIGGDIDMPKAEGRNATLRAFLAAHLADADAIVFEEIVDVAMLRAELAPTGWTCHSYDSATPKHQFVVACVAPELTLTREADDDDLGYQPLAMGSLRPAVAGVLRDATTGAPLARLVGVHLKALPDSTDRRLAQIAVLSDRLGALEARDEQLPVIALGDFNAHRAVDTGKSRDDWDLFSDALAPLGLARVDDPFVNTYRDLNAKAFKLDHMWLGRARASNVAQFGPCSLSWETDRPAIEQYYAEISDHCPLVATVTLPGPG